VHLKGQCCNYKKLQKDWSFTINTSIELQWIVIMPLFLSLCNFIILKLDWFRIALDGLLQLSSYEILVVSRNKFGDGLMLGLAKLN
jgi:hypothetical protein